MFTGIVEEIGKIAAISNSIQISAHKVLTDIHVGDSIAVNGVCLTVTEFTKSSFTVDAMPETLRKTALATLNYGSHVHLERAIAANGRFGGHIVSGHIDGVGTVINYKNDGNAIWLTVKVDKRLIKYIAPKGSITLDGVSLTVVDSLYDSFTVSLIPHTSSVTTLTTHKIGDLINVEVDVLAKYLEQLISTEQTKSNIDMEFLTRCGF